MDEKTPGERLIERIRAMINHPALSMYPSAKTVLEACLVYVHAAESRMSALEASARAHAEIILQRHYGRDVMSLDQLRAVASQAQHEPTLRALAAAEIENGDRNGT